MKTIILTVLVLLLALPLVAHDSDAMRPAWMGESMQKLESALVADHGEDMLSD